MISSAKGQLYNKYNKTKKSHPVKGKILDKYLYLTPDLTNTPIPTPTDPPKPSLTDS